MVVPILNIVIGAAMLVGGATGQLALLGTGSAPALMAVGAVIAGIGMFQLVRSMRGR